MQQLTPEHVQAALEAHGITIQFFDDSTATSQMAADSIGCELGQIAKSIAFMADDVPVLVVASGDGRVDTKKLAAVRGIARKRVKIAKPEQCIEIYGYAPGGMPPLAHRTLDLTIYVDEALGRYEQIYAAGGAHNAIFPLTLPQLMTITGGELVDVRQEE